MIISVGPKFLEKTSARDEEEDRIETGRLRDDIGQKENNDS